MNKQIRPAGNHRSNNHLHSFSRALLASVVVLALNGTLAAQTFSPHLVGPYNTVSGKFFVRLHVVYCQTPADIWADRLGSAELHRRTTRTFSMLNQVFGPHNIHFVPGEREPGSCHSVHTKQGQDAWPEYGDGLTMHVLSDENPGILHVMGGAPSKMLPYGSFWVLGQEEGVPASNLPGVIHEIGACFGLAHTFDFTDLAGTYFGPSASCTSGKCSSGLGGNPDQCCGDMVDDTPAHGIEAVITVSSNCHVSIDPPGVSPAIFSNYMSHCFPIRCQNHFTAQQVRRMRLYLQNSPVLAAFLIKPEKIAAGTPTVWGTLRRQFSPVEVPAGATLIVDDRLEMVPGTSIVVRRGGTLIVNGTITAGCGGMWDGIVVEGTGHWPQKDSTGQPIDRQGYFVLNNTGIIEHAIDGVAARSYEFPTDPGFGGGIIEVYGRIRNCTQSLFIRPYGHLTLPNAGKVSGAFFILDDNYRGDPSVQPVLMKIRSINRLDISGSWFLDVRTQNCSSRLSRAKGIVADNAAFHLRASYFRHLDQGIWSQPIGQAGGRGAYVVEHSRFFNCYTAIESSLPDVFSIVNSYFEVGRPPMCPEEGSAQGLVGVLLRGYHLPSGIAVANNQFKAGHHSASETLVGVDCFGTGAAENTIQHNTFRALTYGIRAGGNNGGLTGLRYACNQHHDNLVADFFVTADGSVRSVQGFVDSTNSSTAAGNRFSGWRRTWENHGTPITYYYQPHDPLQSPAAGTGSVGTVAAPADRARPDCAVPSPDCPPPCTVTEQEAWAGQFFQEKTNWLRPNARYAAVADAPAQADLLREAAAHRSAMDHWGGRLIRDFALDSRGTKTDSVLVWTERLHRYEADLRLARHAFFSGNFSAYDQWLADLPSRHDLTDAQADELAEFAAMLAVVRPHVEAETDLYHLPATALDRLEQWASRCNEPGFVAKVLLRRNGREAATDCSGIAAQRPATTGANSTHPHPLGTKGVRIFPNPTTGRFFVSLPEGSGPVRLALHRSDGRLVLEQQITAATAVDASHLPLGIYFCRVADAGGVLLVTKLIVTR